MSRTAGGAWLKLTARVCRGAVADLPHRQSAARLARACPPSDSLTRPCSYEGKYALLAMPPWLTGRITHDPPLPRRRNQCAQRTPMGAVVKVG